MRTLIAFLLLTTAAYAQAPQIIQPAQVQQALGQKLMEEINSNIQLRAQLLQLQDELEKLKKVDPPKEEKK